jgi:AcrR family transcriptional regulator
LHAPTIPDSALKVMEQMRKPAASGQKGKSDRRFARTQDDLLTALRDLIFSRGYEEITVSDIVERANVGRSTFYEHYENKDDLFRQGLRGIVPVLADAVSEAYDRERLDFVVRHFWEQRGVLATISGGAARVVLAGYLAEELEARLARRRRTKRTAILPLHLIAMQIAEAQIGLLVAWLSSRDVSAERAAAALAASSQAIAAASGL